MASVLQNVWRNPCRIAAAEPRAGRASRRNSAARWKRATSRIVQPRTAAAPACWSMASSKRYGSTSRCRRRSRWLRSAATGGASLFPYSDIDLLVFAAGRVRSGANAPNSSSLSGCCGISDSKWATVFRTIAECVALAAQDITVQTSLLEARLLAGDRKQFRHFEKEFAHALDAQQFLQGQAARAGAAP